jgi:ketosteroid isomerase-like protein
MFNPEVYVGHEGMRRLIADVADAWKEFSDNVERIVEDEGKLVSIQSIRGLGRTSGVRVETRTGLLWTVREGRVSEVVAFLDHEEALRAAGVAADGIRAAGGGR